MKKRYLCPVCEHELTAKSYCPECHRIRREPLIYDGDSLPNERAEEAPGLTSDFYTDTLYPDDCGTAHTYGVPNRDPHKKKAAVPNQPRVPAYTYQETKKKTSHAGNRVLSAVIIAVVLLFVVVTFIGPLKDIAVELWEDMGIETLFEGSKPEPDPVEEAVALSEEEVLEAGEPCNGYCHYDVDGEAYIDRVVSYCTSLYGDDDVSAYEDEAYLNVVDDYTYYEVTTYIDISSHGAYFAVTTDFVTGEVMEVLASAGTREDITQLLLLAACALEPEADRNQVWGEVQEIVSGMEEEYTYIDWCISVVYMEIGEDGDSYLMLDCLPEYDKYQ